MVVKSTLIILYYLQGIKLALFMLFLTDIFKDVKNSDLVIKNLRVFVLKLKSGNLNVGFS